ncbi:hypothetical protein FQA39_LY10080 [Lamprigera yunnana]|nr:hypothetical protein FQA39_LY10080 [Lamprigera yunnana]
MYLTALLVGFVVNYATAVSPCGVKCSCESATYVLPYYWKEFFGTIPLDAVQGGVDEDGDPTYIGQAYLQEFGLLPGSLYKGCPKILTSAYDKDIIRDNYIKILCSNDKYLLKWTPTKQGEHHKLTNCHLVIGGLEVGLTVNIARTRFNGETIIGKAFQDDANNSGLWIPGSRTRFTSYEILTYNC